MYSNVLIKLRSQLKPKYVLNDFLMLKIDSCNKSILGKELFSYSSKSTVFHEGLTFIPRHNR